jgi:hypothetical protein
MCDCTNGSCILRDEKAYYKYVSKIRLDVETPKFRPKGKLAGFDIAVCDTNFEHDVIFETTKGSKCFIQKKLIGYHFRYLETIDINVANYKSIVNQDRWREMMDIKFGMMSQDLRKAERQGLTLKAMFQKSLDLQTDLRCEIRSLKKQIKKLKTVVENDTPEVDIILEDITEIPEQKDSLYVYQQLKDYMVSKNISLGALCKNESLTSEECESVIDQWIDLKYKRLKIAHPRTIPIASHTEFLKILKHTKKI